MLSLPWFRSRFVKRSRKRPRNKKPARVRLEVLELENRILPSGLPNVLVNNPAEDTTSQNTQSETAIAVAQNGNVVSVFNDSGSNATGSPQFTGWANSTNGGTSFTDQGTLPLTSPGDVGDPVLAENNVNGTIYLSTLSYNNSNQVDLFKSTNNGLSFTYVGNSAGNWSTSNFLDKPWLAVDNASGTGQGTLYQGYTDFGGFFGSTDNGIYVTHSTTGGTTWSSPVRVSGPNTQGLSLAVGTNHTVYAAYWNGNSATESIQLTKSTNGGVSFNYNSPVTVTTLHTTGGNGDLGLSTGSAGPTPNQSFQTNAFPQLTVNPVNGDLYLVYNDTGTTPGDNADIYFTMSTNGGTTWSTPQRINDDTTTNDQFMPAIAVTPNGQEVGIFWYDRRNDPSNSLIDYYGAIGNVNPTTGAITFGANFQVSDQSFPAVTNQDPSIRTGYMGDYNMAAADNNYFYTTWGDNRDPSTSPPQTNQPDVYFAKVPTATDHLAFAQQPANTTAGSAINAGLTTPGVTVDVLDQNNQLVTTDNSDTVTLTVASGPGGFTNTSTVTATVSGGVATFNNLVLDTAGNYTLGESGSSGLTGSNSNSFTVSPAQASQLVFGQQPTDAQVNATISPAVTVKLEDQYNNVLSGDNTDQVSLGITPNTGTGGANLSGGGAVQVSSGVATFSNLAIDAAGTGYTLTASSGALSSSPSNSFNITAPQATHFSVTGLPTSMTAGDTYTITVTALDASNHTAANYSGTVQLTSSDGQAVLSPSSSLLTNGVGTFQVTLKTAGNQTVTAADSGNSSISGQDATTVNPAAAYQLVFGQQPSNATANVAISPAVTVKVEDKYDNVLTGDSTDQVGLTITPNTGTSGATLSGGGAVTVSGGVATFSNLTINTAGTGYKLSASSGSLTGATSNTFNVSPATKVVEGFETNSPSTYLSTNYKIVGGSNFTASVDTAAHHDGTYGLDQSGSNEWIYRNDPTVQFGEGQTISVWVQMNKSADGRAYFGFGTTSSGTLSAVLAPNTNQFLIQSNSGFNNYSNIGIANAPVGGYKANQWYLLQVAWGTSGTITANLYGSNGTALLDTVSAQTPASWATSGGIAFRNSGNHHKYWDTVTVSAGASPASPHSPAATDSFSVSSNNSAVAPDAPLSDKGTSSSTTSTNTAEAQQLWQTIGLPGKPPSNLVNALAAIWQGQTVPSTMDKQLEELLTKYLQTSSSLASWDDVRSDPPLTTVSGLDELFASDWLGE
jgi:hypothetical protein